MGKQPNRGDGPTAARARRASGAAFGPILRLLAFSAVGCTAASAAIWMYPRTAVPGADAVAAAEPARAGPARKVAAEPVRNAPAQPPVVQAAAAPAGVTRSLAGALPPAGSGDAGAARTLPPARVDAGARPVTAPPGTPAAPSPGTSAQPARGVTAAAAPPPSDAPAAPQPAQADAPAAPALPSTAKAPTECLPAEFKALIRDLEARFGRVTLVSTTTLNTNNHGKGTVRHKLHADCKAVDFKVAGDVKAVTQFLRSRPEVLGVNAFGNNGVIHMDFNDRRRTAARN